MPPVSAACDEYRRVPGGAWPWCDGCGWRWDLHDDPQGKAWGKHLRLNDDEESAA